MIEIKKIKVGKEDYPTNCYLIHNNINGIIIDPGYDINKILENINKIKIKYIILTHTHADHIGELEKLVTITNAKVVIHENDIDGLYDDEKSHYTNLNINFQNIDTSNIISVKDKDEVILDNIILEIIHTPGHTSGCICIYLKSENILFTGDTIFAEYYGRCDLKSGSFTDMKQSITKLFDRFDDILIHPGHEESCNINYSKKRINLLISIKERQ
ncbi:MAG: MBL fold metallo-hydrolase [Clostridia bacterium]